MRLFIILLIIIRFSGSLSGQSNFEDITLQSGIEHAHIAPNLMGGGVAILDYNNDGFEDIYFTGGVYEDKLFRNNGDSTFTEIGASTDIYKETRITQTTAAISGDIDNDGWNDIFVTTEPGENNILFHNLGNGEFINIASQAGIDDKSWSMGAAFIDINLDGFLDIYVVNYIDEVIPRIGSDGSIIGFDHQCFPNVLYINNGDNTFIEMSEEYGVNSVGCGLAVTTSDINGDHIPDLYIANDFGEWIIPNQVYQNEFPAIQCIENASVYNLDLKLYGMGIGVGDIDHDCELDYYITNLGNNALMNKSNESFIDITTTANVGAGKAGDFNSTGWGTQIFDFDHDGDEDLFVSNGYIGAAPFLQTTTKDPNRLFVNDGMGTFSESASNSILGNDAVSRGTATFDYDNDGDLDLVVSNISNVSTNAANVSLYSNSIGQEKSWLKIMLEGVINNRNGLGSKVYCFAGSKIYIEEVYGGGSHASYSSSYAHFGLNSIEKLDSIQIIWPGGSLQTIQDVEVNQFLRIKEGVDQYDIIGCMQVDNEYYNDKATFNRGCLVEQELVTSLIDTHEYSEISISPNPANNMLNINNSGIEPVSVDIFDLTGKPTRSFKLLNQSLIDISELQHGAYILRINNTYSFRFIKSMGN